MVVLELSLAQMYGQEAVFLSLVMGWRGESELLGGT